MTNTPHPIADSAVFRSSDGLADCIGEEPWSEDEPGPRIVSALPAGRRELLSFLATSSVGRLSISGALRHEEERLSDLLLLSEESCHWLAGSVLDSIAIDDPSRGTVRVIFDLRAHRRERLCLEPLADRLALLASLPRDRRWPPSWLVAPSGSPNESDELAARLEGASGVRSLLLVRRLISVGSELGRAPDGAPFRFSDGSGSH